MKDTVKFRSNGFEGTSHSYPLLPQSVVGNVGVEGVENVWGLEVIVVGVSFGFARAKFYWLSRWWLCHLKPLLLESGHTAFNAFNVSDRQLMSCVSK